MTAARHALTVLTRLARGRPTEAVKLRRALAGRRGELWGAAFEVALEVGDPLAQVLGKLLKTETPPAPVGELVQSLPEQTVALGEVA